MHAEGNAVANEVIEPDIDLNASNNEPPEAQAVLVDSKTSSVTTTYEIPSVTSATTPDQHPSNPATAPVGTTTTTSYTIPASTPYVGVPAPHGAPPANVRFFGRAPQMMRCPYCAVDAVTRPRSQIDACTVITAVILLLVFWPVFWIPFVVPVSTKQALRQ
jgi:hypothetical protein